jgi:hypothetical protein
MGMSLGLGLGLGRGYRPSLPAAALISSVDASGWSGQWRTGTPPTFTPDSAPSTITVSRLGYTAAGATTTYPTETRIFTKRVRQAYPSQASLSTATVALDDYVYSTDSISGVTNNSAEISPKPIAHWQQPDRIIVGNTIAGEIVAFHRDGRSNKPVACVIVTATDGVNTPVSQTVSAMTISTSTGDACPVPVYAYSLDISTLSDNATITVNAQVYPWIGAAASILDSSAGTADAGGFVPQKYYKRTARLAAPYYAYVATTGSDTTGVASTTAATASASPCLTIGGAWVKLRAAIGSADVDGCVVRLKDGTYVFGAGDVFNTYQANARNIIERDPSSTSRASVILQFGASAISYSNIKYLLFRDLTINRMGSQSLASAGGATGLFAMQDVTLDCAGNAFRLTNTRLMMLGGITLLNAENSNSFQPHSSQMVALFRGVTGGATGGVTALEGFNVVGCNLIRPGIGNLAGRFSGSIVAFNKILKASSETWSPSSESFTGMAFVQNLLEWIGTTNNPAIGPQRDSGVGNATHLIVWHNTIAAANIMARSNLLYDDGPNGNLRTHKLQSFVGNIHTQINSKNDFYAGTHSVADATSHVGNWAYAHGVGCRAELSMYVDAGPNQAAFRQDYPGLAASIGTSETVRNDPLFVNYQGVTYNGTTYTAGAGGGDYSLQNGSPCAAKVTTCPLPYDLAGTARSSSSAQGAYEYPF